VTFDDGFRSVYDHARPILDQLGIPATVFVPTALMGQSSPMSWPGIDGWQGTPYEDQLRGMGWDELQQLRDAGWEIGSHGQTHPNLPQLGQQALGAELTGSRETLELELGEPCRTLAYPYGAHDARVRESVREAGYEAAATLRPGRPDPLRWPRVGVYPVDSLRRFRIKVLPSVRRLRATGLGQHIERARGRGGSQAKN
jgi:peptidoglycan/xylan/chitin deacetylase (PgdA/CDA1 family)